MIWELDFCPKEKTINLNLQTFPHSFKKRSSAHLDNLFSEYFHSCWLSGETGREKQQLLKLFWLVFIKMTFLSWRNRFKVKAIQTSGISFSHPQERIRTNTVKPTKSINPYTICIICIREMSQFEIRQRNTGNALSISCLCALHFFKIKQLSNINISGPRLPPSTTTEIAYPALIPLFIPQRCQVASYRNI